MSGHSKIHKSAKRSWKSLAIRLVSRCVHADTRNMTTTHTPAGTYTRTVAPIGFLITHESGDTANVLTHREAAAWIAAHTEAKAPISAVCEAQEERCETVHVRVGNGAVIHLAQQGTNPYGAAFLHTLCGAEGRGGHNYIPRVVNAAATCKRCTGA